MLWKLTYDGLEAASLLMQEAVEMVHEEGWLNGEHPGGQVLFSVRAVDASTVVIVCNEVFYLGTLVEHFIDRFAFARVAIEQEQPTAEEQAAAVQWLERTVPA